MNKLHEPVPSSEWLAKPAFSPTQHSMVIGSRCGANLERLGCQVAGHLNRHKPGVPDFWHPFSYEHLRHFAGDPA